MTVTITGAAGFLGQRVAVELAKRGTRLLLTDIVPPPRPPPGAEVVVGELSETLPKVITQETSAVINLAAVVSSGAEADFDHGYAVNLLLLREQLEACRALGTCPKFVSTSSLAVFGAVERVDDATAAMPQSSYRTQKALGELLVNDYGRRGFVDGRTLRLPTVSIRPGKPNAAASGFASGILREPLAGVPSTCPVSEELGIWLASPYTVTAAIWHGYDLPASDFAPWRAINTPGITVSVGEMMAALERNGGDVGLVRFERDPKIESIVGSWPARFETPRALSLGFPAAADLDGMIAEHIAEMAAAPAD
jgi:nucleoside-diphosphate-sugar epimerase